MTLTMVCRWSRLSWASQRSAYSPPQPDRGLVRAELLDGFGVQLGDPSGLGVGISLGRGRHPLQVRAGVRGLSLLEREGLLGVRLVLLVPGGVIA